MPTLRASLDLSCLEGWAKNRDLPYITPCPHTLMGSEIVLKGSFMVGRVFSHGSVVRASEIGGVEKSRPKDSEAVTNNEKITNFE